jgi:large subunit ribosomal protein L13
MTKTYSVKASEIQRDWHLVDATYQVLGKLATRVAQLLMGKHKPMFSKHLDTGDNVVVVNAAKVKVTGNKMKNKLYYRHTGYPGGLKSINLEKLMETHPERVIEYAVKGMVPHNKLGVQMMKKLRVYAGAEHPHQSQVNQASAEAGQEE